MSMDISSICDIYYLSSDRITFILKIRMTLASFVDATEPVEPIFSKELVQIRKYLLILVSIQWVG